MYDDTRGRHSAGARSRGDHRRRRKARRRRGAWSAVGAVLLAAAVGTYGWAHGHRDPSRPVAALSAPNVSKAPVPMDLGPGLAQVTGGLAGSRLSVALLDVASGDRAAYGDGAFDTASIVKVDILSTLLLQAQDASRVLTAQEKAYATDMIENSDNDATSALWTVIGSAPGLDAANKRFGLTGTQGGEGTAWGVTSTVAKDQIRMLQIVFDTEGTHSPLTPASRTYIQGLMSHVAEDQAWGVSAAADPGTGTALKNGWLERTATKKWDVNSIGRIVAGGRTYLLAVLTSGFATEEAGISTVEQAARAAVAAFAASH